MEVGQRLQDVGRPPPDVFDRHAAQAIQPLGQVLALDVTHHQVLALPEDHKMIDDAGQAGMTQRRQQASFARKLAHCFVGNELVFLDRTIDLQVEIPGSVNRAHAALGDQAINPITVAQDVAEY